MPSWLQFSLLDMTPYDRQSWFRLIENYQYDHPWLPLISLLFTGLVAILLLRKPPHAPRLALTLLATCWFWCGGIFQMQYHANLNWAAPVFGWLFIGQSILLLFAAIIGKTLSWRDLKHWHAWPALAVLLLAVLTPLFGLLEGRSAEQLEWFALMPLPTTIMTLGMLMILDSCWRFVLMLIPVLWALTSAAFGWTLGLSEPYITAVTLLALLTAVFMPPIKTAHKSR